MAISQEEVGKKGTYYDSISGEWLDTELVQAARKEDMADVKKHKVYEKVDIKECYDRTGKAPIGTRWVDVNKGDTVHPEYRSRLVAQEVNTNRREDLFAATPPLEAKKMLMSMAVTDGIGFRAGRRTEGMKLDFVDVRSAYSHAKSRRELYVALPNEDWEEGKCGKLLKAMYGTRDAAQNWEYAYVEALEAMGFTKGKATPCAFYMKERNLRLVVHGDDFTVLGMEEDLDWFRRKISEVFEVKFRGRLGPAERDDKCIRILNRVVEWTSGGIEYEADQRHAEIIFKKLGLDEKAKGVSTPGSRKEWEPEEENELEPRDATMYRALVARGNYMAQDRTDVQFAVKELCRIMSNPTAGYWAAAKRLGRHLVDKTRVKVRIPYQEAAEQSW